MENDMSIIASILPSKGIFHPNKFKDSLPESVISSSTTNSFLLAIRVLVVLYYSDSYIIYLCFMLIDEGYLNSILQQISCYWRQLIIRDPDLETNQYPRIWSRQW